MQCGSMDRNAKNPGLFAERLSGLVCQGEGVVGELSDHLVLP